MAESRSPGGDRAGPSEAAVDRVARALPESVALLFPERQRLAQHLLEVAYAVDGVVPAEAEARVRELTEERDRWRMEAEGYREVLGCPANELEEAVAVGARLLLENFDQQPSRDRHWAEDRVRAILEAALSPRRALSFLSPWE